MNKTRKIFVCLIIYVITVVILNISNDAVFLPSYIRHFKSNLFSAKIDPRSPNCPQSSPDDKTTGAPSRKWQKVGRSDQVYVFSAYYKEHEHIVEMVVIAEWRKLKSKFQCAFPTSKGNMTTTIGTLEHVDHPPAYTKFRTVYIRCPIPMFLHPATVQLQFEDHSSTLKIIHNCPNLYDFVVCYPSFFNNFSDALSLIETVETNMLFGAEFFTVYNHTVTADVDKVFRHYVDLGKMEVIPWNKPDTNVHHDGQWAHLQDCHLANRYKAKYIVIQDVDELIVPHKHRNWHDMMVEVESSSVATGSFTFYHSYFEMKPESDEEKHKYKLNSLTHVWRQKEFHPKGHFTKAIHQPARVSTAGIHFSMQLVNGHVERYVDTQVAFVHHYRKGTTSVTNRVKDEFMRTYSHDLEMNVNKTLSELGLSLV